ncbi:MAG: VWA domain-containing protein [Candidatus Acidiferrales bacterium]
MNRAAHKIVAIFLAAGLAMGSAPTGAQQQSTGAAGGDATTNAAPVAVPAPSAKTPRQSSQGQAQASRVPVLRSSSDLVRIDVEVTDRSGKPITGLREDQFTVMDDGKPQKIANFSYADIEKVETAGGEDAKPIVVPVDIEEPAAAPAIGEAVRDRRMIVLFFDLTSMETDDLIRAHDSSLKFVQKQMTPADLVAVVTFSSRLSVLANFTNDHATLEKAVAQIVPGVSAGLADPLYAAAQNGEEDVQEYTGAAYTPDETEFNVFNTDQKLAAVENLADVLGAIPGRKSVVEFTGGITQTGEENRTQLRAATDAANRADVSIYSIDARGLFALPPGGDTSTGAASGTSMFSGASVYHQTDQREDSRDTLATLSTDTGGRSFFDLGDLSDAFPKIQADNTGYYLLGYTLPPDVKRDGRWHTIRVKVAASGAHVRYRSGYYAPKDFQHFASEDRKQQLSEAMQSESPYVDLPIAVETSMFRLNEQQIYVPIAAKISSSALQWAQKRGAREASFDFAAEVRAYPDWRTVAQLQDTIHVKLDAQRYAQVSGSNLLYEGGLVLSPGRYRMKFLARENESGHIGSFEDDLILPPLQADRLTLSSVLLSNQLEPVAKSSEVQTKGQGRQAKIETSPLEMSGEKIIPNVTRLFTQQQTLYVFFQAYCPEKVDPNVLRASLIFFRSGVEINATPLLAPASVDASTRTASYRISLPLSKLPVGHYSVQVVVVGPGTQHSAFGRAYLALRQPEAAAPTPASVAPVPASETPKTP